MLLLPVWVCPGALAAGASGAGAATDLLDAPNSKCTKEFLGSAAIVLGDGLGGELSAVAATRLRCGEFD